MKILSQSIKKKDIFQFQASLPMLKKEGRQKKSTLCGGIYSILAVLLYATYSIQNVAKFFNDNYDTY